MAKKILCFPCRGPGFYLWSGNWTLHEASLITWAGIYSWDLTHPTSSWAGRSFQQSSLEAAPVPSLLKQQGLASALSDHVSTGFLLWNNSRMCAPCEFQDQTFLVSSSSQSRALTPFSWNFWWRIYHVPGFEWAWPVHSPPKVLC